MSLKLYTYPGNFRAFKALIAAQYNGVAVEVPPFRMGVDNKTQAFKDINPLGKVPVLETPQGSIFESNAIARYIANMRRDTELMGETFFESGQVDSWIDFCTNELEVPVGAIIFPILGFMPNNPQVTGKAFGDLKKALAMLERHLTTRTFMVGRSITLADIILVSALYYPMKLVLDKKGRKPFTCVERWFLTCVNQPAFAAVLGDVELCTEVQRAPATEGAAAAGGGGKKKGKKGKGESKQQPKQSKKKKNKKKAAEPEEELDIGMPPPEKKKAHPCSLLPPTSMKMDTWKKMYSNNDHATVAMPWFWENLDREGYSVWFHDYNYNAENKIFFMTRNAVNGFLQRCDSMRKYAFGVVFILGEEGVASQFNITGCWLLRGQDVAPMLEENPDAEYHTWTKADLSDEATRARIHTYWTSEETLNGEVIGDWMEFK